MRWLWLSLLLCGCAAGATAQPAACVEDLQSPIRNFCQVTPNVLWRGSKPDAAGASWLIAHGVKSIVNLELLRDDRDAMASASPPLAVDDRPELREAVAASTHPYTVAYYRVRDWEPLPVIAPWLSDDHVAHFLAIMSQAPKPVYVHCFAGENRTSVMVAAYRIIVEGAEIEQAVEDMQRYHGYWFKADAAYLRGLTPQRRDHLRHEALEQAPKVKSDALLLCEQGRCRMMEP